MLNKYELFVSSQATDFGEALRRHDEFWVCQFIILLLLAFFNLCKDYDSMWLLPTCPSQLSLCQICVSQCTHHVYIVVLSNTLLWLKCIHSVRFCIQYFSPVFVIIHAYECFFLISLTIPLHCGVHRSFFDWLECILHPLSCCTSWSYLLV